MSNENTLPNGPTKNNFFQMVQFIRQPIKLLEKCRDTHGKTFMLRLLGHPRCIIISDPSDLKQVFSTDADQLVAGEINAALFRPILGNDSLFTLDGKKATGSTNQLQYRLIASLKCTSHS